MRFEQEHIDLLWNDAHADTCPEGSTQRQRQGPAHLSQTVLRVQPHRQIEIVAFMPDFDTRAAEFVETRNLLPQSFGNGADHGHCLDLLEVRECFRHHVGGHAKLALLFHHGPVLSLDLGAPHNVTPAA